LIFYTERRANRLAEKAYFSGQNLLWGKITRIPNIPLIEHKQYRHKGAVRTKRQVVPKDRQPPAVEAIAHRIPDWCWYRRTVLKGTQGAITYEFTKRRVTLCRDGLPDRTVWLVMKRRLGEHPVYWYYISNAPLSSRLPVFIWLSGVRWAIEQCFEEAKTELGMDHYEVRTYLGWHHHMLTSMLAHFFLWHLKIRLGKKAPALTVSQLRVLLEVVLPKRTFTIEDILALVTWMQRRNHRAYLSHRKRREAEG
jgi:SRSO17 transposase